MEFVLTLNSDVRCDHAPPEDPANPPKTPQAALQFQKLQDVLVVDSAYVVISVDWDKTLISSGCVRTNSANGEKPCSKVSSLLKGKSEVLRIGGSYVVLANAIGLTDGTPNGTSNSWSVKKAKQTILRSD